MTKGSDHRASGNYQYFGGRSGGPAGTSAQTGVVRRGSQKDPPGPVTRLPSFIKDGLVTAPKDIRLTRGHFTPRAEVKVNLVRLGQSLDHVAGSRSLNEELGTPRVRTRGADLLPEPKGNSLVQNAKRKDQLRRLQMSSQDPAVRPTFQLPRLQRSLTFTLPKLERSPSLIWATSHLPTPRPMADLRTPWLDPKVQNPDPPETPLKLSEVKSHLVSGEGGWMAELLRLQREVGRGQDLGGRVSGRKAVVKVWQPTVDSVLKSEAMKNYWVKRRTQNGHRD